MLFFHYITLSQTLFTGNPKIKNTCQFMQLNRIIQIYLVPLGSEDDYSSN